MSSRQSTFLLSASTSSSAGHVLYSQNSFLVDTLTERGVTVGVARVVLSVAVGLGVEVSVVVSVPS